MRDRAAHLADLAAGLLFRLAIALTAAFLLVPLLVAAVLSFDDRTFLGPFPPPVWSLRWYRAFLDNPAYVEGLWTSLTLALVSTAIAAAAGTAAAIALADPATRARGALETIFLSPKFVPTVVVGFSVLVFASAIGVFDPFTRLVMGHVVITIPFTVRAVLASLVGIRRSVVEAAMSLGATERRALFDIVQPLARTGIVAGAVMAFVLSFDEVAVSLFLSDAFTQTLPIALIAEMRANLNLTIAAVSTVFVVLTLAVLLLLDRLVGLDRVVGQGVYRT
jgi:putative spermidine/putrescine transport system permease protein